MRITCPTCAAAYEVPKERIAGGRAVRCARCGSGWVPLADEVPLAPPPAPAPGQVMPESAAPDQPAAPVRLPPSPDAQAAAVPPVAAEGRSARLPVLLAWATSFALLGALAWAMVAWRVDVMRAWPPSERLYAALGLLRQPDAR